LRRAIIFYQAQTGYLVFTPFINQLAVPLWIIACIARFYIQAQAANAAPGFDTERTLFELVDLHVRGYGIEFGAFLRWENRYFRTREPVDQDYYLA
jgi:uncharacterized membrane protein